MSRSVAKVSAPVSRPTGVDYFLILAGCCLSLLLANVSRPVPKPNSDAPAWVKETLLEPPLDLQIKELFGDHHRPLPVLTLLLLLPEGIILLWPVFYTLQLIQGRPQALSAGEWLWGFAWLGTVLLTGWTLWMHWSPPAFAKDLTYSPQAIWTILVLPSMAFIAVVIGLISLVAGWKQTWTHTFGLVLIIWPVVPMAGLVLWTELPWKWVN
jgi:hypothetical protein